MDWEFVWDITPDILKGLRTTVDLFLWSLLFSTIGGLVLALMRLSVFGDGRDRLCHRVVTREQRPEHDRTIRPENVNGVLLGIQRSVKGACQIVHQHRPIHSMDLLQQTSSMLLVDTIDLEPTFPSNVFAVSRLTAGH